MLAAWIEEKGSERMQRLYEEHILRHKPEKAEEYGNSVLQKLFKRGVRI